MFTVMLEKKQDIPRRTRLAIERRAAPCLALLDMSGQIISADVRLNDFLRDAGAPPHENGTLPEAIDSIVQKAIARPVNGGYSDAAVPLENVLARVSVLAGPAGRCIAVSLERLQPRDPLPRAAAQYGLSPREVSVLALILEGLDSREIGHRLGIATSTVREYFKHLYEKTGARNRSSMFAKVFGWPESK